MPIHVFARRNIVRQSIKALCLSTSLLSLLGTQAYSQQIKADGTTVVVPTGAVVDTSGQSSPNGFGLYSTNGGVITGTDISVITDGHSAFGVLAEGPRSEVNMTGGSVRTTGELSSAVATRNGGGTINLDGVDIHVSGANSDGVWAQHGGVINVKNSNIVTDGSSTHAVWAYGGDISLADSTITTNGDYARGLFVSDTGTIDAVGVIINTSGSTSHGVQMSSGTVVMRNSSITTTGDGAIGVWNSGGQADLIDTTISTGNAHGIVAQDGGTVNATNVDVTTTGDAAHGATAIGAGSAVNVYGGSYSTSGANSAGIEARDGASVVVDRDSRTGEGTIIHTTGDGAVGVLAQNGSLVKIAGATIKTEGDRLSTFFAAVGVLATKGSAVSITDTVIETKGTEADGVVAEGPGSHVGMVGGSISTGGGNASGAVAYSGGTVDLTGVNIVTEQGRGIAAGDEGSVLTMNGGTIVAKGSGPEQSAVFAVRGATANVNGVSVLTEGDDARGLHAFGSGSTINATDSEITTVGVGSHGAFASTGGTINLDGSVVKTEGDGANGVVANSGSTVTAKDTYILTEGEGSAGISLSNDSSANLSNSSVWSEHGPALKTESGVANFSLSNGTQVVGNDGVLLDAAAGSETTLTADGDVKMFGDIVGETPDTVIDTALTDHSYWEGAGIGVTTLSLDQTSYWKLTGSSDVGALDHAGVVEFESGSDYKTLNLGAYSGNGGSFIINTELNEGGLSSQTDKIVVDGDTTGVGKVYVRNNGGTGASTGTGATDGIQIIEIGGNSDAEFELGAAAIVGIYDYQLLKADGQNWYLQTDGDDPINCAPGDNCPTDPSGGGHVVDIVPGYNIALSAAQNHVLTALDTFHERLGELRSDAAEDGFHAWTRGVGKTGSYSPKSVTGYNGHGFDMTTGGVQIGGDYSSSNVFLNGDKLTFGLFGEYSHSTFDVAGRTAHGSIGSKGIGGYATWQQNAPTDRKPGTGAYLDAVLKQDWLDFSVSAKSVSGFGLKSGYSGQATSASIEAGYGFDLGSDVVLQPQAQLAWSKISADSFTDPYGIAVYGQGAESLMVRVGLRLEKTFYFDDRIETPATEQPKSTAGSTAIAPVQKKRGIESVTTFIDANIKHEMLGQNGLVASDTAIGSDMSGTRYDVGAGVVARISDNVSFYGRGSVEFGGSTEIAGKVTGGFKVSW